jgi:hypothetical protein
LRKRALLPSLWRRAPAPALRGANRPGGPTPPPLRLWTIVPYTCVQSQGFAKKTWAGAFPGGILPAAGVTASIEAGNKNRLFQVGTAVLSHGDFHYTAGMNAAPKPQLRWHQYRLRSLLVLLVLVALGGYWYVQHRKANIAREAYGSMAMAYQEGSATAVDVCEASLRLCEAEEQVPLACVERAQALHLARVVELQRGMRTKHDETPYGTSEREAARLELVNISEYRDRVQDALRARH